MSQDNSQKKKKKNENDYFNLDSTDDDEEEAEKTETDRDFERKKRLWDWDMEENRKLYPERASADASQRLPTSSTAGKKSKPERYEETGGSNPTVNFEPPRIENVADSSDAVFNLYGHSAAVNRIHWAKTGHEKGLLLSSSMDK